MRESFFILIILFFSSSLFAQQEPLIKIYLNNDSTKQFKIEDIKDINFNTNNSNSIIKIFYKDVVESYFAKNIDKIEIIKDTTNKLLLSIIISNKQNNYFLSEINKIEIQKFEPPVIDTVKIGNKVWMKKNLDVVTYRNGDTIPQITKKSDWLDCTTGAWCYYNNDSTNNKIYGKLYNWYAANDPRGLAPDGWHVPSEIEWKDLSYFLGGSEVGGKLKSTGTIENGDGNWYSPNTGASNSSSFSAQPGGYRDGVGNFGYFGEKSFWVTSGDYHNSLAIYFYTSYDNSNLTSSRLVKNIGFSVRCVRLPFETPIIENIQPLTACIGDEIIVNGAGFGISQGNSVINFNGTNATEYKSWNDTLIKVKVPLEATPGKVAFIKESYRSNEIDYIVYGKMSDIDGNIYKTIKIGNQVWMAENLNVSHYCTGELIPQIKDSLLWSKLNNGAWCYYNNDIGIGSEYGKLYNGYTINDQRGLAPVGWHIPSKAEWDTLSKVVGGNGTKLKESGSTHWINSNDPATNSLGFSALPGGWRDCLSNGARYMSLQSSGYWWTCTSNGQYIYSIVIESYNSYIQTNSWSICYGYSVRCIKDSSFSPPVIANIVPKTTLIGSIITINGTGFGLIKGTSFVSFNHIKATEFINWSKTQIIVKVPDGVEAGKLSITVEGQQSNDVDYDIFVFGTITDIDGNIYKTIPIGNQTWMAENLNVSRYRNGETIPQIQDQEQWEKSTNGAWRYYNDDPANGTIYGKLYNWYAVNDPRGLAPSGWHVPSDNEWESLSTFVGGGSDAGGKLKETGTTHWLSPNTGATNEFGFSALPGGRYASSGYFNGIGTSAIWWTSTPHSATGAYGRSLGKDGSALNSGYTSNITGYSVRCIKD